MKEGLSEEIREELEELKKHIYPILRPNACDWQLGDRYLDMGMIFVVSEDGEFKPGDQLGVLKKGLLEKIDMPFEELKEAALENNRFRPWKMFDLHKFISSTLGGEIAENDSGIAWVVTGGIDRWYGASAMLDKDIMAMAAATAGGSAWVIPSSVHEVIILKKTPGDRIDVLKELIRSINETEVEEADRLSDNVYEVNSKGEVKLA